MGEGKFGIPMGPGNTSEQDSVPENIPSEESVRRAWEAKRDEYLGEAVRKVLKNTEKNVVDTIFGNLDAPEWAGVISDVRSQLIIDHKIPWDEHSVSGDTDARDENIAESLDNLEKEYPEEEIRIQTIAAIELGY